MIVDVNGHMSELVDADAEIEQITTGFRFTEGPVWDSKENCLLFCRPRDHEISRWSRKDGLSVFREKSGSATGLTFDSQHRLIACEPRISREGSGRRVGRTNLDGTIEAIATHYEGGRVSGPNDLICLANDDVIFTDPEGALHHADGTVSPRETPFNAVYRISAADGSVNLVTGEIESPNGIVKRDGGELLIADRSNVWSCGVDGSNLRLFKDLKHGDVVGSADGMKLDSLGNLYVSGRTEGMWIIDPKGELIGFINVGERAINMCWGEEDWKTLFIESATSVYRVRMNVAGQQLNPK